VRQAAITAWKTSWTRPIALTCEACSAWAGASPSFSLSSEAKSWLRSNVGKTTSPPEVKNASSMPSSSRAAFWTWKSRRPSGGASPAKRERRMRKRWLTRAAYPL
jgi:hypothetical protein